MTGPMLGRDLWLDVISAAGNRCQCTGQCGRLCARPRATDRRRSSWDGRCERYGSETRPLHAVPTEHVAGIAAMTLPAAEHAALCDGCHRGVLTARNRADRETAAKLLAEAPPPCSRPDLGAAA